MRLKYLFLGFVVLAFGGSTVARAADSETESMFDVAFGGTVTTDYEFRGITQTDHNPAVQGYVEVDISSFYAGVFASNVDFGSSDAEIDLSVGWRPEVGSFAFDFGFVQYLYANNTTPTYGELYAQVDYTASDWLTLGSKVYFAPDVSQSDTSSVYAEGNTTITLPWNFSISGAVGYQEFDSSFGASYLTWNAGLSWVWKDTVTFDVRYWDTDLSGAECANLGTRANSCDARVVGSISVDTSWSALKELMGNGR